MKANDTRALDDSIATLQSNKDRWARLPLDRKIDYLRSLLKGTVAVAERQVKAAIAAKGIPADSPTAGEEWLGGPVIQARIIRQMIENLTYLMTHGQPKLPDGAVRTRSDGQVIVDVFPHSALDGVLYKGFRAEVWMEPGVTSSNLKDTMAVFYREHDPVGKVALVLGAGNVANIGPLDVIYKLFVEGQVVLLKWNPVNDYLGPFVDEAFADLVKDGFLRSAYGGADVGEYLTQHAGIDEIHITGSDRTHDAIVFGTGAEGLQRKQDKQPRITKRITSELGNVSPCIVVPGQWSDKELQFQAENVATQMANNGGFNCNATKVLILHDAWPQKKAFLDTLRAVLAKAPQRKAYYPGAEDRYQRFVSVHPQAQPIGPRSPGVLPWTLIPDIPATADDDICFTQESFCGVTAQTALPGVDAAAFLKNAVKFCNDTLWGTLSCVVLIHPKTQKQLGAAFEQAIADLKYGSIAINHWAALSYALGQTTWGAHPGHTLEDIQSGIGVVHNTFMFDKPQKSVVYGPFRIFPKPLWFVTNKQTLNVAKKMVRVEADPSFRHVPGLLFSAIRG